MSFASSSVEQLGYIKEVTFGVTPVAGNYTKLRMVGETLEYNIEKMSSDEINNTRTTSSMIPVGASASGGVNTEISYREYDPFLESVLQSTFVAHGTNGVSPAFIGTFTATTITASVATTFNVLKKGQFFRLVTPGHANDGKICRVSLTTAPTTTVITVEASTPLVVGTSIAACTVATSRLTNGVTQSSFSIERQNSDISEYWVYKGMTPSTWNFAVTTGGKSTMSFDFMGKKAVRAAVTNLPGTPVESQTYEIHSGATGPVCLLWVDGAPLAGTFVQSASITYDNVLRSQSSACEVGAVGVGSGTVVCKGTMEVYFAEGSLFDKFADNTNISFSMSTLDALGNGYIVTLPKANLSKVATQAGGKDQDMILSIEFTALRDAANADATLRQLIFVDRVGVAAV